MKNKVSIVLAALMLALVALMVSPSAASAATGNKVCVTGSVNSWVDVKYSGSTTFTQIVYGRCSLANAVGFSVPNGQYCKSPWGYTYDGGLFGRYYGFSTNNNYLTLDCHHA